eukprot:gene8889-9067_t
MADMFGLGALSLPGDLARLGWLPGLSCLFFFAATDIYSGVVYQRLTMVCPNAMVFDEIGRAAMGTAGSALVYVTVYLTILCEPIIFHLTCVEALQQMLQASSLSRLTASLIVTVLVTPMAQIHKMEEVAWVSILGTVGMLTAAVIMVGKLLTMSPAPPGLGLPEAPRASGASHTRGSGYHSAVVGLMDITFAFGGQANWMRYITTMKQRSKFSTAVAITTGLMTVVYLLVAVTGYAVFGSAVDVDRPISSVVGEDMWGVMLNAGVFLHCIIAYQVIVNVWCSLLLQLFAPRYAEELSLSNSWSKKGLWMAITLLCIAFAGTVAYIFPFFSIVMAVIASLGDVMSMFGLPCLFAIKLLRLPKWE